MNKHFISAQSLLEDSYRLALSVLRSGYRPRFLVGIWRGGSPVAIAMHELMEFYGFDLEHMPVRTSHYSGVDTRKGEVEVYGLDGVLGLMHPGDRLLVVDDVFDSGRSIEALTNALRERAPAGEPAEMRIATVYYKPSRNKTQLSPDYFLHETEDWLVFPHELDGLSVSEAVAGKSLGLELPPRDSFT